MCVHWIPLFYHKTDDDVNDDDDDDDSASSWLSWWHPFFSFIILFSIILSISQFWEALKRTIALYTHTQLLRAQAPENQSHCLFVSTVLVCMCACACVCVHSIVDYFISRVVAVAAASCQLSACEVLQLLMMMTLLMMMVNSEKLSFSLLLLFFLNEAN